MERCPNCSYKLVLLPNRLKYKCSLCSKLYPQKLIDNKEFRELNKRQKLIDTENFEREYKEKLIETKELRKSINQLFNPPKYLKSKAEIQEWVKQNTLTKEYKKKIKNRLYWERQKQKQLTLQYLENCNEKLCINEIFKSPPTFAPCELLFKILYQCKLVSIHLDFEIRP